MQGNSPHLRREAATPLGVRLLRVRLFYKILVANVGLLLLGAAAGLLLVRSLSPEISMSTAFLRFGLVAMLFLFLGTLVHTYLVRAALSPLRILEQTARQVETGDVDARVEESPLADLEMSRIVRVFNAMLDTLGAHRLQERARSARTLKAQENERFRTSRELYDQLAQTLAGVLVRLRGVADDGNSSAPPQRRAQLEEVRTEVQQALERVRDVARRLHPPELDELGLAAAIKAQARALEESSELDIEVITSRPLPRLGAEPRLAVFRIVQEALQNIQQHADARRCVVGLDIASGRLEVAVRDDGQGFDPEDDTIQRKGLGIAGMFDRAAHAGGRLSIQSRLGQGTTVFLTVPLVRSEPPVSRRDGPRLERDRSAPLDTAVEHATNA